MQKNNVKSFICSFLFSILAVCTVQKVFLHTKSKEVPEKSLNNEIGPKISLFAEHQKATVLPAIQKAKAEKTNEISKSNLEVAIRISQNEPDAKEVPVVQPISPQEQKPSVPHTQTVSTDLNVAEEITFSEEEQKLLAEERNLDQTGIIYADISDTREKDTFDTADASLSEEIPLVEDNITVHSQISLQSEASASQVAMVGANTLINSMEDPDILAEEKNLAEADIKKSELGKMMSLSDNTQETDETPWEVAVAASEDFSDMNKTETVEEYVEDSPWVIAKGNKYAKNQAAVEAYNTLPIKDEEVPEQIQEEIQTVPNENDVESESAELITNEQESENQSIMAEETTALHQTFNEPLLKEKDNTSKLAYEMIQNILIPIPDSILNDTDMIPDLTSSPDDVRVKPKRVAVQKPDLSENEKQSGLFKSISSWFSKNKDEGKDLNDPNSKDKKEKTGAFQNFKDKVYSALGSVDDYKNINDVSIMPAELRLSFAPNRAEISGQTLKWIYAFADNARDHNDVYVEVRIDGTSSYALQQKRLNLLSSIFASRGVDYRKINTVFTSREPNSFIIRNIRFNIDNKGETNE